MCEAIFQISDFRVVQRIGEFYMAGDADQRIGSYISRYPVFAFLFCMDYCVGRVGGIKGTPWIIKTITAREIL